MEVWPLVCGGYRSNLALEMRGLSLEHCLDTVWKMTPCPPGLFGATALRGLWRTLWVTFPISKGFLEEVMGCKRELGIMEYGKGEVGLRCVEENSGGQERAEKAEGKPKDCLYFWVSASSSPPSHTYMTPPTYLLWISHQTSFINRLITRLIKDAESKQQEGNLLLITV